VRFAAQLGFSIDAATDASIRSNAEGIDRVAQERVRDELLKLMAQRHTAPWLCYLDDVGLLTRIVPELEPARNCAQPSQHFLPVLGHLLEAVAAFDWLYAELISNPLPVSAMSMTSTTPLRLPMAVQQHPELSAALPMADQLLRLLQEPMSNGHQRYAYFKLAVLLHDVGKPATASVKPGGRITFYDHQMVGAEMVGKIAQRLRLGRDVGSYLQLVVREHMRPGQLRGLGPELTRRALYRFMRDSGGAAPDVLLHSLCDHLAARGPYLQLDDWTHHVLWTTAVLNEDWIARPEQRPVRLISGNDVVQILGVPAGPLVGRVLAAVEEAQFVGDVKTREEALAVAAEIVRSTLPAKM
jgi:putative nucleotidyltransferase with HDIG domain